MAGRTADNALADIHDTHAAWGVTEQRIAEAAGIATQGNRQAAIALYRRTIAADPSAPLPRFHCAQLLWAEGAKADAAELAVEAYELGLRHSDVVAAVQGFLGALRVENRNAPAPLRTRFEAAFDSREPTVALAMITKDEEEHLPGCLASVAGLVSQIVLVDTGSTDATIDIANEHGAEVHEFAWTDDFAAARNVSLRHVKADWVLWLDADEELLPESHAPLRALLRDPEAAGAHLCINNLMGDRTVSFLTTRLWRHAPTVRFRQPIHEQILWSIGPHARRHGRHVVEARDIVIRHYGYQPSVAAKRNKEQRNMALLEKLVGDEPDNAYALFHYASALREVGRHDDAFEAFARWEPMAMREDESQVHWLRVGFANYAAALNSAERYEEASTLLARAEGKCGQGASFHYQRALALHRLGRNEAALQEMDAADAATRNVSASVESIDFQPMLVPMLTAEIYSALGREDDARTMFSEAAAAAPDDPSPRVSLARLDIAAGELDAAAAHLQAALTSQPDAPLTLTTLAQVELYRRNLDEAIALLTRAAETDVSGEAERLLGEALLISGDEDAAFQAWQDAEQDTTTAAARALIAGADGSLEAFRGLDTAARAVFWTFVGKVSALAADTDVPASRLLERFARHARDDPSARADLMRTFLKHRFRSGIDALQAAR
jgi:glycosyltransferase involved in cell wall biosynthesis/predicted negative regulator of RcsB-dependent stress response